MTAAGDWIAKADEDLRTARLALANGLWSPACFHAQQAGEKWIKALYETFGLPVPRIHDLETLLEGLEDHGIDASSVMEAAAVLTAYGVDARYPGFDADAGEAAEAVEKAETLAAWAARHLRS
ncbi:MAG: HEPN domain-containing protein [Firmicutes bacterium]|nr:HEPN domain-containing protein [Bacillota bacterium]